MKSTPMPTFTTTTLSKDQDNDTSTKNELDAIINDTTKDSVDNVEKKEVKFIEVKTNGSDNTTQDVFPFTLNKSAFIPIQFSGNKPPPSPVFGPYSLKNNVANVDKPKQHSDWQPEIFKFGPTYSSPSIPIFADVLNTDNTNDFGFGQHYTKNNTLPSIFEQQPSKNRKKKNGPSGTKKHSTFEGQYLNNKKFTKNNLTNANFKNSILTNVIFKENNLSGATFKGSIIKNVKFIENDLTGATFKDSIIKDINFTDNIMEDINFDETIIKCDDM
jgi:hypothetical protein